MSRAPSAGDFHVDVDGEGRFCFARRTMGDVYKIRGRYNQLTEGFYDEEGRMADLSALGYVTIQTLLVEGPDGFNLDRMDPLIDDNYDDRIFKIFGALREKELSFRPKSKVRSEAPGPGNGDDAQSVVSQDVPAGADRSEVPGSNS